MKIQSQTVRFRRRSLAEWRLLIGRFRESQDTVHAFCKAENISTSSFYKWRARCDAAESASLPAGEVSVGQQAAEFTAGAVHGGFLEIHPSESLPRAAPTHVGSPEIVVRCPNGAIVELFGQTAVDSVERILNAVISVSSC